MTAAYQLRVSLKDAYPSIWRCLLVPAELTLYQLHQVIQIAMGWGNGHLHLFEIGGKFYSSTSVNLAADIPPSRDEHSVKLPQVLIFEQQRARYTYDFGDDWEHELIVERLFQERPELPLPICLNGERACPPEDCGGIWGYAMVCEALAHPADPDLSEFADWVEPDFAPDVFDLARVNRQLERVFQTQEPQRGHASFQPKP